MSDKDIRDKLLSSLDKVILEGHWDQGLFSKNILKRLQSLRQRVSDAPLDDASDSDVSLSSKFPHHPEKKEGYSRVYVAIFQTQGDRMDRWEHMIKNLRDFSASRPVYTKEEYAQELMRSKRGRSDAYVVLWMKNEDIMTPVGGHLPFDKFHHALFLLNPNGVKPENVIAFVHDGRQYNYQAGKLISIE